MESDLLCNAHGIRDIDELMDAEARFRALFDATYPAVVRFVRHRGLVGHDGEDLIAATYEVAWRRLDVVPTGDAAVPWLLTVALNQLRNHRRRQARDRALVERLPAPGQSAPPPEPSIPGWRDIRRALDALTESDRELVLLVAWDGLQPRAGGECSRADADGGAHAASPRPDAVGGPARDPTRRPKPTVVAWPGWPDRGGQEV